jgi:hypothetical protein
MHILYHHAVNAARAINASLPDRLFHNLGHTFAVGGRAGQRSDVNHAYHGFMFNEERAAHLSSTKPLRRKYVNHKFSGENGPDEGHSKAALRRCKHESNSIGLHGF